MRAKIDPIIRDGIETEITSNFVKFAPAWRNTAEAALTAVPAFVIG